jgi:hypothetical protein
MNTLMKQNSDQGDTNAKKEKEIQRERKSAARSSERHGIELSSQQSSHTTWRAARRTDRRPEGRSHRRGPWRATAADGTGRFL